MTRSRANYRQARRESRAFLLRVGSLLLFVFVYLLLFIPGAAWLDIVLATLIPAALALWWGPLGLLAADQRQKWYDPVTLFNSAMFYYVIKGVTLASDELPAHLRFLTFDVIVQNYLLVCLYVILGLVAWNSAYRYTIQRQAKRQPRPERVSADVSVNKPARGVILLSLMGSVAFFLFFRSIHSSILVFITNPLQRSYLTDGTLGISSPLPNVWRLSVGMFPAATMFWLAMIGSRQQRPGIWWWLHAAISMGLYLLIGGRAELLGFALSLIIIYHLLVKRLSLINIVPFVAAGLAYSYVISTWRGVIGGMSRGTLQAGRVELADRVSMGGLFAFLSSTDLTDIRTFVLISDAYGRILPFEYGATLLRIVSQFVPRSLWPGKPVDLGLEVANLYMPGSLAGIPPGFDGEMYMNLHVFGVVAGSVLLGIGLAWLYWRLIALNAGPQGVALYAIVASRLLLLPSATFANLVSGVIIMATGLMLAFAVSRPRLRRRANASLPSANPKGVVYKT